MDISWSDQIRRTIQKFLDDKGSRLGAALTFYMAFSIVPLLTLSAAVTSLFYGADAVQGELKQQLAEIVGDERAGVLEDMIAAAEKSRLADSRHPLIPTIALILGSAGVFIDLKNAMNLIWGVEVKPELGMWGVIKDSAMSFLMFAIVVLLLFLSMVLTALLSGLRNTFDLPIVVEMVDLTVSWTVTTLLFAMIFKYLPDVDVFWKDVWIGSIATALMFAIGKYLVGLYLTTTHVGTAYGTASSLLGFLLWMYYSSQIFFLGAEFTQVYAHARGRYVQPLSNVRLIRSTGASLTLR